MGLLTCQAGYDGYMMTVTRDDEDTLLALLNTTPVRDGAPTDELSDAQRAQQWAVWKGGLGTPAEVSALRRVRDAVQDVVRDRRDPRGLSDELDRIALRPRLVDGSLEWEIDVAEDERLAARALLTWALIEQRLPGRLRACANDECHLFLLDRSNGNRARWCSMATCGNRLKARRHVERARRAGRELS